jgi:hypothetical protein
MRDTQEYVCVSKPEGRSLVTDEERARLSDEELRALAYSRWMERRMTGRIAALDRLEGISDGDLTLGTHPKCGAEGQQCAISPHSDLWTLFESIQD